MQDQFNKSHLQVAQFSTVLGGSHFQASGFAGGGTTGRVDELISFVIPQNQMQQIGYRYA